MVALADAFDGLRFTVNIVPSLIEQIDDYVSGRRSDRYLDLSRRPTIELDAEERRFVVENFFSCNEANMIGRYPRFAELHHRQRHRVRGREADLFTDGEMRDLVLLFNLAWIDPSFLTDPDLKLLADKGKDFSEEEKQFVLDRQLEILAGIVPLYRRLAEKGTIELSTSPAYHPILPLLLDSESAREAMPYVVLPRTRLSYPDDFDYHVVHGREIYERAFGVRPAGMWPSEGSISDSAVRRLIQHGVRWLASDEGVLARSRLAGNDPPDPRHPYLVEADGERAALIFRNQRLSDLIGFTYMHWNPAAAAADFVEEVVRAGRLRPMAGGRPPLVPVILDGENCWEHYPEDGIFFLRELYSRLAGDPRIETVTVSDYLERHPPERRIDRVYAGSWINHDYTIWIGHPEDNAAWDLLAATRATLERHTPPEWSWRQMAAAAASEPAAAASGSPERPALAKAWRHLYIAEGSDWFWWYGDEHWCNHLDVFDQLFRGHLIAAYEALGLEVPPECMRAIKGRFGRLPSSEQVPVRFIAPSIDGRVTHFYEWKLAGQVDATQNGATMRIGARELSHLHYGFDLDHLYLRVDGVEKFSQTSNEEERRLWIELSRPQRVRIELSLAPADGRRRQPLVFSHDDGGFRRRETEGVYAVRDVMEVEIPFAELAVSHGDTVEVAVMLVHDGRTLEALPSHGPLVFRAPDPDFEATMWSAS